MTTTPRFPWWISLALLVPGGLMAFVFWGPCAALSAIGRPAAEENILRIAYTQLLLPDPQHRTFPVSSQNQFTLSLWEPLVEGDPATGQPQPAAALNWEWSPDRRSLRFRLRPEARWSNGDPVRAEDFVRAWLRLLRANSDLAQTLYPLRNAEAYHLGKLETAETVGVHAVDDHTLELELDHPRATLLAELEDPLLSPLHATGEKVLGSYAYFGQPAALVTNGPFRLTHADYDGYRMEANPFYYDRAAVRLAGLQFIRADNLSMAALLVASGVVDLASPLPGGPLRTMPTNRPLAVDTELVLGVTSIDLNVRRGPLRDVRVRQALSLALDRAGAIQRFDPEHMVPAWSWVAGMPGRPGLNLLHEDAAEARRLLAEAGYPGGQGFPVLRMALPLRMRADPFPQAWTERWFQELGIKTYITYEPQPAVTRRVMAGDFDVFSGMLIATVPDAGDMLSTFSMPAQYSVTKWQDPDVMRLLKEADLLNGAARRAAMEAAERRAMAALPTVPVMFERRQSLRAAEVQGWYADPLARQSPKRFWLENIPAAAGPVPPRA